MKAEEAIEILKNGGWWDLLIPITTVEGRIEENKMHEAIDTAISALRSLVESKDKDVSTLTEPLTLEQLREMDGKPVWCEWLLPEDRKVETGGWFIVVKGEKGLEIKRPLDFGSHVCKNENYGTGWLAYPYPLPHIDREAWEPCEWCGSVGKKPDNWVCSLEDDNGHTVTNDHMVVCATANYCPSCGRPLTEEAWAELERRLRK